ncbi:MAG: beta-glucosidase [Spirochaetes bacterium]|nr:beta-glucosidase [Spirochaetota bacterium]
MFEYTFPKDFVWGAATASFQVEGATEEDGRGKSTWDAFCARPGKVVNNDTGERACDHYHRIKDDVALLKNLGVNAYRFSLAWPRIMPAGEGKVNSKGLDFYNGLIDELLRANITPYVTLFHWDLPLALEEKYGGWKSKETAKRFAEFAAVVTQKYSDRVKNWMTINEIMCFTIMAYRDDRHAPGGKENAKTVNQSVHNALYGHGLAMQAIREHAKTKPRVGLVENLATVWPVWHSDEHIAAAKKAFRDMNLSRLFPVFEGGYDEAYISKLGPDAPGYTLDEMKVIGAPMDFIGYNIYSGTPVRHADNEAGYETVPVPADFPKTDMGWPITPKTMYYTMQFTKEYFKDIPVYITENGMAAADVERDNGEVLDLGRLEYIRTHLEQLSKAVNEGMNLRGYFVWSLMDNFEWAFGYTKRFGIVRVNYATMQRTPKLSAQYYSDVIKANRVL